MAETKIVSVEDVERFIEQHDGAGHMRVYIAYDALKAFVDRFGDGIDTRQEMAAGCFLPDLVSYLADIRDRGASIMLGGWLMVDGDRADVDIDEIVIDVPASLPCDELVACISLFAAYHHADEFAIEPYDGTIRMHAWWD